MCKKIITIGEVMMRLSTPGNERFVQANSYEAVFGGSEANVSICLANWDQEAYHVTAFPGHDIGKAATRYLRQTGVKTDFVYFSEGRMGLYFLENGSMQRASKIIYDRFESAFSNFDGNDIDWDLVFDGADWFHWTGITPAISQSSADVCLEAVKIASKMGVTISTDLNYRAKLWKYGGDREAIMTELTSYCDVILGNEEDAEMHPSKINSLFCFFHVLFVKC